MDKYEFNIKVEQIRKLVNKSDYETAMKIADTIDWKKVRNANLLSMIAQVYEKNNEYQDAKDILLLAFERAPIGKRLLYKLTELALKEENVEEAEAYYREFCELSGDDPRQHLLRYMILKQKGAPTEQLIHSLEGYTSEELDEKWLYELAALYHEAGMEDKCVSTCDKIMLMFGLGKYVDKAMELKLQHAPLTKYQMDLVENREKYEAKLRAVEQSFQDVAAPDEAVDHSPIKKTKLQMQQAKKETEEAEKAQETAPAGMAVSAAAEDRAFESEQLTEEEAAAETERNAAVSSESMAKPAAAVRQEAAAKPAAAVRQEAAANPAAEPEAEHETEPASKYPEMTVKASEAAQDIHQDLIPKASYETETLQAAVKQAETEEHLAKEMSRLAGGRMPEEESELGKTRVLSSIRRLKPEQENVSEPVSGVRLSVAEAFDDELDQEPELPKMANHLMIEARTPEKGLELAVQTLKQIQKETGVKNPVIKITGSKLNKRGILANAGKLAGKDLLIEEAGDLTPAMIKELERLMAQDVTGMRIILIDNPKQMEMLHAKNSSLASRFECIGAGDLPLAEPDKPEAQKQETRKPKIQKPEVQRPETEEPEETPIERKKDDRPVRHVVPVNDTAMRAPDDPRIYEEEQEPEDDEEMDIDEFAQYACKYASEIDCSITGKSMLALYERIEIMEEDGILLTKANAEALIEEAADKAEKPSIGRRIKGIFSSKYDKDGLLILKEEHFI